MGLEVSSKNEARGLQKNEARGLQKNEARGLQKNEARGLQKNEARVSPYTTHEPYVFMLKSCYTLIHLSLATA